MSWFNLKYEIDYLLEQAQWKPWETRQLTYRERKYWVRYYKAQEELRTIENITR